MNVDPVKISSELQTLHGGVVDTSTLIYLEQLQLSKTAAEYFQLLVPPDVVREFGTTPPGCLVCGEPCPAGADRAVLQLAVELRLPVLSEDRKLLMSCRAPGVKYYNTMMLLLALLLQKKIDLAEYEKGYERLHEIARYSPAVWQVGKQVFSLYVR